MGGGKSTLTALLRDEGFVALDADEIVHRVLRQGGVAEREVLQTFGQNLRGAGGALDRRALGRLVFADPVKLARLESILHPLVRAEVARARRELEGRGETVAFYDVPLLFEKNMQADFDHILVVTASESARRARVKARLGLSDADFDERSSRQLPVEVKEKGASVVVRNEGTRDDLRVEMNRALRALGITSRGSSPR